MKTILNLILLLALPSLLYAGQGEKAGTCYKEGICNKICKRVNSLLYDSPNGQRKTATCSWNDDYLLIKAKNALNKDRMLRFTFLAFSAFGFLVNENYIMPGKVYVGYGDHCQVMTSLQTAKLHRAEKYDIDQGFQSAMVMSADATKIVCPKK